MVLELFQAEVKSSNYFKVTVLFVKYLIVWNEFAQGCF